MRDSAQNPAYFGAKHRWTQKQLHIGAAKGNNHRMSQADADPKLRQTFRGNRDALLQRAADEPDLTWRVLTTLNAIRVLVAVGLLSLIHI